MKKGKWGAPSVEGGAGRPARGAGGRGEASPLLLLIVLAGLWVSCKTAPEFPDPVLGESAFFPLEPGALVYVCADVGEARPILDLLPIMGMSEKQSKEMLDRTSSAVAAWYPAASGRRFQLAAWGNYPGFRADMAFGADRNWKKQRSAAGLPYWHSARDGLSVALNAKQAFVAASRDDVPAGPFSAPPGVEVPEDFGSFRRGALIACWFEEPAALVNRIFAAMELPLQLPAERILLSVFPEGGPAAAPEGDGETAERRYEALVRMRFSTEAQARGVSALFALAGAFLSGGMAEGPAALAAVFFAHPPVQDGRNLHLRTAALTEGEIALLFRLFSLYFG